MVAVAHGARRTRDADIALHAFAAVAYSIFWAAALALRVVSTDETWMAAQAAAGAVVVYLLWRRLDWHGDAVLSFGGILLLATAVNRVLYMGDVLVSGGRIPLWPFESDAEWWALARAEWMTIVGTILVCLSWRRSGGNLASRYATAGLVHGHAAQSGYWLLFAAAVTLELLRQRGVLPNALTQLATVTYSGGLAAVVALNARRTTPLALLMKAPLMTLPLAYLAMGTGMKEAIIVSVLPLAVILWRGFPQFWMRVALVAAGGVFVSMITMYVGQFRERAWSNAEDVSVGDVVRGYSRDIESTANFDVLGEGIKGFLARSNATYHRGWAVDLADKEGFEPMSIFGQIPLVFVPRFLWPGKPDFEPGQEHSARLFGESYRAWSTSSTAAGYFSALYLGAGWLGFIAGAVAAGYMIGRLQRLLLRWSNPYMISAFSWVALLFAVRLDDSWPVYVLTGPIISFVYVFAVGSAIRVITRMLRPTSVHAGQSARNPVGTMAPGRRFDG